MLEQEEKISFDTRKERLSYQPRRIGEKEKIGERR
jgi:hypothetical protein